MRHLTTLLHSFFFNDTATTEIYTLSLHDALPISCDLTTSGAMRTERSSCVPLMATLTMPPPDEASTFISAISFCSFSRSEEHTSELQSQSNLVCRLLLEKKKSKLLQLLSFVLREC